MSSAPRPQTQPSFSSPDHGSSDQSLGSASTVSTCPQRQSVGPSPRPRRRAIRFGRPSTADEQLALEAGRRERVAQELLRRLLVAGRVDRVEADQPLQQLGGAAFELRWLGHAGESRTCAMADQLFDTGDEPRAARRRVPPRTSRSPRGCARRRSTSSSARSTCSGRARRCGPRSRRAGRIRWCSTGRRARARPRSRACSRATRAPRSRRRRPSTPASRRCATCSSAPSTAAARAARATVFFLDEIHRFNKAQQDALLPAVEEGLIALVGATTENPYFEVNSALVSRVQVYEFRKLGDDDVRRRCCAARSTDERGLAGAGARRGRGARLPRGALGRRRARRARRARGGGRDGRRRHGDDRGRRGRDAAQGGALRQGRRPPLRHDLRLDQGDARVRPRRVAALPRDHARGRRGRALHRAPDGDPRERGHRQRRPARARDRGRRRARGRARRPAGVRAQPRPGGGLPRRSRRSRTRRTRR